MTQQGQGFLQQLGNYKLVRVIGQGGFATVYLGKHVHLKASYAAVKVLKVEAQVDLFKKEAQTIMELAHPNIMRVLDFGIQDDITFIIMEYAPYGSLQSQYKLGTIVPIDAVLSYVNQAAAALQYAHDHRIIHRDVKPSNLLIGKQQAVLLSDFGIALLAESSRSHTRDAAGTIAYIAPEQIRGKPRAASDQYALAVTVYEWLCGKRPFRGTLAEITVQHLSSPPPSLRSHNPKISVDVEDVVLQALAKDPMQRFPSIQQFASALEHAAGVRPRSLSQESFTTQNMVRSTRDTVVLPVERDSRPSREIAGMPTRLDQSSRGLASVRTIVGEEPGAGQSRMSARQPGRRPPLLPRRTILIGLTAIGVGGIASLAFAALHSSPPTSQTLVRPTSAAQPSAPGAVATKAPIPTPQSTPNPTPAPQPTLDPAPTADLTPAGTLFVTYRGHAATVDTVAWSPDGTRLASGSADNTVQIWDAEGGNLNIYSGHTKSVDYVAWSPDGRRVVSASDDKTAKIWNANGANILTLTGHTDNVHCAAFSPHGTRIASGSGDTTVKLWDAANGNLLATYSDHTATVWVVAWSPDGTRVGSAAGNAHATIPDNTIKIWNVNTGITTLTYSGHTSTAIYLAWSPDGRRIASGSVDNTVQVWDAITGTTLLTYRGHNNTVYGVAWSPDGKRIASGSVDNTVQIWDATSGNTQYTYRGHTSTVFGLAWSPDGSRIASASSDKTVQVWHA
ncbi:MAG: serine/threonine-protein kinase [Ktedonobacteraceae bacterium]